MKGVVVIYQRRKRVIVPDPIINCDFCHFYNWFGWTAIIYNLE